MDAINITNKNIIITHSQVSNGPVLKIIILNLLHLKRECLTFIGWVNLKQSFCDWIPHLHSLKARAHVIEWMPVHNVIRSHRNRMFYPRIGVVSVQSNLALAPVVRVGVFGEQVCVCCFVFFHFNKYQFRFLLVQNLVHLHQLQWWCQIL